jgi:hypothetical protein
MAILLMSTKGFPKTQLATKGSAEPLPGQPSPEKVDKSEKSQPQLQEVPNTLSESQDKLSPKTKTPLKSAQNKKDSDENEDKESLDPEVHSTEEHCKNNETSFIDFSSNKQNLPPDS